MPGMMASLAGRFVLILLVTTGMAAEGVRTPVFRGAMGLLGRSLALFEVQGNAGTWQGEVGRTLPGTQWRIEKIDLSLGQVTIRVAGKAVTLSQGDTYQGERVLKAPEPVRAPAPLSRATDRAGGWPQRVPTVSADAVGRELSAALADPRVRAQLRALGLPVPAGRPGTAASAEAVPPPRHEPAPTGPTRSPGRDRVVPPVESPGRDPRMPPAVPLIRALDASVTVPRITSLGKPGYQTVVMLTSSASADCRKLRPRVLALSRRPRTAVVFVDMGADEHAPVRAAWNAGALPHFLLLDASGGVLASGDTARTVIDSWLPR